MANWPPVDPANLAEADPDDLGNMATGFTYEPGSTFKAFTVAGALQEHLVTPDTVFDLPPTIQVADRTIEDAEARPGREPHRGPDPRPVLERRRGQDRPRSSAATEFDKWVRRFGFGKPTGIQLSRRGAGHRDPPRRTTRARRWATCRSARASR